MTVRLKGERKETGMDAGNWGKAAHAARLAA
jgi:hypothetical protein